jgi:hypothetical protein
MSKKQIVPNTAFTPKDVTGKFPATTKKCNLLDKFVDQEKSGEEKKPQVKANVRLEKIKEKFSEFLKGSFETDDYYDFTLNIVKKLDYTDEDVTLFSVSLAEFQHEKNFEVRTGLFLEVLINNCDAKAFVIKLDHLSVPIAYWGRLDTDKTLYSN